MLRSLDGGQDDRTALMCAAYNGHTEAVKLLVEAKASLEASNKVSLSGRSGGLRGRCFLGRQVLYCSD